MINILITGSTGFLGSSIINSISGKNYRFISLYRKESNFRRVKKFKNNEKYIISSSNLKKIFKKYKIDLILHSATHYGTNDVDTSNITNANLVLPLRLLALAKQYNVKRFINTDTILPKNISSYTLSKHQFNEWLKTYSNSLFCCNVRIEHFFGPGDDSSKFVIRIINKLIKNVSYINLTKGNQKRDFVFIKDVVDAIKIIIKDSLRYKNGYTNYDIGKGVSISIKKFILLVCKLTRNKSTKLNFGILKLRKREAMDIKVNISKLKKLGWKPKCNLHSALIKTIKYYI